MALDKCNSSSKSTDNSTGNPISSTNTERPSRNAFLTQGWGSRMNFQLSYGLKPGNDDDWEEGNRILDALMESDMDERREQSAQRSR
ncbi:hypothetical protein MMC06_006672 [Schaereria dolodes]|nr:hypothetical protein [Schaereria dolodes]